MSVLTRCTETTGPIASICSRHLTWYNIIMHVTCGGATYIIFFRSLDQCCPSVFSHHADTTKPIAFIFSSHPTGYNVIMHINCGGATLHGSGFMVIFPPSRRVDGFRPAPTPTQRLPSRLLSYVADTLHSVIQLCTSCVVAPPYMVGKLICSASLLHYTVYRYLLKNWLFGDPYTVRCRIFKLLARWRTLRCQISTTSIKCWLISAPGVNITKPTSGQ